MKYQEIREQICDVCHKMWQLGWVAANDGNVSVKLPDGNFLATPLALALIVYCIVEPEMHKVNVRLFFHIVDYPIYNSFSHPIF